MYGFPCRLLAVALFPLISWASGSSKESTQDLIALIPPGVGLVTGLEARQRDSERPSFFIPMPGKSLRDFDYFNSLLGADTAKVVNEVIFVDDHLDRDAYEHTLLSRGHFSSEILYRSALSRGAVEESYRGLRVLRVSPLARERPEFHEITWLVIVDSRVLLLGTPEYVRRELDRLLGWSSPDPWWASEFAAVQRSDVWWIMPKPGNMSLVYDAVLPLNPDLAELFTQSNYRVGMRYGKLVIFEYQIGVLANGEQVSAPAVPASERTGAGRLAIVSGEAPISHGVIRIPRDRYQRWVTEIAAYPHSYR